MNFRCFFIIIYLNLTILWQIPAKKLVASVAVCVWHFSASYYSWSLLLRSNRLSTVSSTTLYPRRLMILKLCLGAGTWLDPLRLSWPSQLPLWTSIGPTILELREPHWLSETTMDKTSDLLFLSNTAWPRLISASCTINISKTTRLNLSHGLTRKFEIL